MNADNSKKIKILLIALLAIGLTIWLVKRVEKPKVAALPLLQVTIQKPQLKKITDYVIQTGSLVAFNSVDLVARIKGYLDSVEFVDGTIVKKGQLLFVIEPESYLEQLKQAQADLAAKTAAYEYAQAEHARQKRMYAQQATSLNNVEKWTARVAEYKAEIDKAVANVKIATINYSYTHVLAPFDGRIGRHLVDPGNLVGNGEATDLATIEQINPIYVYFNLNELDLIKVRTSVKNNVMTPQNIEEIPVYVKMQNETDFVHQGKMNFVNTGLNASTGTMEFRALLENSDFVLLPGLFVQVRIPVGKALEQLTVPDIAVQYDQIGPYIFTVDKNNIVVLKRVTLGTLEQDRRAILKGLNAEDNVVINGLQNAIPGNSVKPL